MRPPVLLGWLLAGLFAGSGPSDAVDPLREEFVQEGIGSRLDATLTRWAGYGFSGTVLLERGGVIWLHKSYGEAYPAGTPEGRTDSPLPADPMLGQFATLTILRLEIESRLSTTDRLGVHFDGLPESDRQRTIHDLLRDRATDPALLLQLIAKSTGERPDSALHARILAPAKMRFTGRMPGSSDAGIVRGRHVEESTLRSISRLPGSGWWIDRFGGSLARAASKARDVPLGAEEPPFVTTAGDLYQLELALRGDAVLTTDAKQKLFNPISNDRSYGWLFERTTQGTSRVAYEAQGNGTEIGFYRYPDDQTVLILLLDTDMGWRRPVRDLAERTTFSGRSIWIVAAAAAVILYFILRTAMDRRLGESVFRRRLKRRFPSRNSRG